MALLVCRAIAAKVIVVSGFREQKKVEVACLGQRIWLRNNAFLLCRSKDQSRAG